MRRCGEGYQLGVLTIFLVRSRGDTIFGPAVTQRLMHYFVTVRPPIADDAFPELTEDEYQIPGPPGAELQ